MKMLALLFTKLEQIRNRFVASKREKEDEYTSILRNAIIMQAHWVDGKIKVTESTL